MRARTEAAPIVVKFGGELLEEHGRARTAGILADCLRRAGASANRPVVVVHGGGKEIDAALKAAGIEKRQVDGLRITDEPTLDIVVSVLAGAVNTTFVAALVAAGVPAVGLTGADAACGLCEPAPPHRSVDGRVVDLGRVGLPVSASDPRLLHTLAGAGFVPVVACIGIDAAGRLYNVNADTLAGHLAARLGAERLVIAGTTSGVLDDAGSTLSLLDGGGVERLVSSGTATAGMIAKLRASEQAIAAGVPEVVILDGRNAAALEAALRGSPAAPGTTVIAAGNRGAGRSALHVARPFAAATPRG
jgi:acetylglutamate kinase